MPLAPSHLTCRSARCCRTPPLPASPGAADSLHSETTTCSIHLLWNAVTSFHTNWTPCVLSPELNMFGMLSWWNAQLMECSADGMLSWWNAQLMECSADGMLSWWNAQLIRTVCPSSQHSVSKALLYLSKAKTKIHTKTDIPHQNWKQCSSLYFAQNAGNISENDCAAVDHFSIVPFWALFTLDCERVTAAYRLFNIRQSGVLAALFGCYMADVTWCCCHLGKHSLYTIQPGTSL